MSFHTVYLSAFLGLILVGCAHPIKVTPDMTRLEAVSTTPQRMAAKVGYYISPEVASVEVTTQGGGGDNVRYYPYRDMELGFHKMLSNVFESVVKLSSLSDRPTRDGSGLNYVIVPTIVTTSGGSGFFTWPPSNFSVDLTSQIRNVDGKMIASQRVVGVGAASTAERLSEHGIAGRRAMEDALLKMQSALFEANLHGEPKTLSPAARNPIEPRQGRETSSTTVDKLGLIERLKVLLDSGALTQQEFEREKGKILGAQ